MKTVYRTSFLKDLKAVRDKQLLSRVKEAIGNIEKADALTDLQNLKQLKGEKRYYRIRIGETGLGCILKATLLR